MAAAWEIVTVGMSPGDDGQVLVIDRTAGCGGRTVCVVPGRLLRQADGTFMRRLDDKDIGNARLLAAAPQLRAVLTDLAAWAVRMSIAGGPAWQEAAGVLASILNPPG